MEGFFVIFSTAVFFTCFTLVIVHLYDEKRKRKEQEKEGKRRAKTKVIKYGHMEICIGPVEDDDSKYDFAAIDDMYRKIDTIVKENQCPPR